MMVLAGATGCGSGESGWTQWSGSGSNGHWYKIDSNRTTWEAAQSAASGGGHYLATITSAAEEQFIVSTFLTGAAQKQVFWIGGTDKVDGDTWKWVTGESFSYTNWKDWEPSGDGDYLCINWNAVRGDPLGQWNDAPNAGTTGYDNGANDGPYASLVESDKSP
jgi:Lectin C-type domain